MTIKKIKEEVFKTKSIFIISTEKELKKYTKRRYSDNIYKEIKSFFGERGYNGLHILVLEKNETIVWINSELEEIDMLETAIHEITHLVDNIEYNRQFEDTETRAYLTGFYFSKFLKMINYDRRTEKELA